MDNPPRSKGRIVYLSNHLRGPRGAAGARSWHQARALSTDFDVTVIIPAIDPVTSLSVTPETWGGLNDRVNVIPVWSTSNNRNSKISRVMFFLSGMVSQFYHGLKASRPDLVLSMSLPVTQLFVALLLARIRRVPLVVDVRDLPFEMAHEVGYIKNRFLFRLMAKIENFCLRGAARVITNSPRYKPYLVQKGVAAEHITIAHIGYDDFPPPQAAEVEDWRTRLLERSGDSTRFLATYAGTIGYAVPVEDLLDAARLLKRKTAIGLVIVGDGQRLGELRKIVEEQGLNVVFTGRVTKAEVHAICRASDICLYPAHGGDFSAAMLGNKVFDYLGAEKPVVYSGPDSAVSDIIAELEAGIVCPAQDTRALAQSIELLAGDQALLARYARAAGGFREAGYTAEKSAMKLKNLVESLV